MPRVFRFSGGRYARLLFNALILALLGVALYFGGTFFGGSFAITNFLFTFIGIVLVGLAVLGAGAAVLALVLVRSTTVKLEPDTLTILAGDREIDKVALGEVQAIVADYERVLAGRKGLRFDPPQLTGLRLFSRFSNTLIKGSLFSAQDREALGQALQGMTGLAPEKIIMGPEVARVELVTEKHELKPEPGLALLTPQHIVAFHDNRERVIATRHGRTLLLLRLDEIASVQLDNARLFIQAKDGVSHEMTFAYGGEEADRKNRQDATRWHTELTRRL